MKKTKNTRVQSNKPQPYKPERWTNETAHPAGEDHKKWGSLQADGTIKPYRAPLHGCVGNLKDTKGHARN